MRALARLSPTIVAEAPSPTFVHHGLCDRFSRQRDTMRYSSRQALEQVIDRARKLADSPLAKGTLDFDIRWAPPEPPAVSGADAVKLQAAVRLARQFMQPDDLVCIGTLPDRLADDDDLRPAFKRDLEKVVRRLDTALDQVPAMRVKLKGTTTPAHRIVLEAFFEGNLDGLESEQQEALRLWLAHPASAMLIRSQIQTGLSALLKSVQEVRRACERELLHAAG